jgi:uncharacterized protein YeaC (DUF1315 family)
MPRRGRPKLTEEQKALSKQKKKLYQAKYYQEKGKKNYELARDLLQKHKNEEVKKE